MSNRRKHKTLTLKDKMTIINMLDNGETMAEVAEHFGIGRSTIHDIKSRRSKIMQHVNISDKRKTLKFGKYPELDTALYNWFLEERAMNNPVSGDILREKAKEIYMNMTGENFKASSGWLDKFKKRYGIKFNVSGVTGEKPSFRSRDENVIFDFVKSFKEKVEQLHLTPDQLYCIDASGLFLRVFEENPSIFKEENESKKSPQDRITFMPCSNATGTHKFDLLVIGKEPAEEFKDMSIPVCYKYQRNSWVTRDLFTEWFHEEFVPNVRSFMIMNNLPEKALLVLDEAPGYPEEYYLKSNDWMIQAMFLPAEYSHLIQPIDKNLIQTLKSRFRKKLLLDVISKGGDIKLNLKDLTMTNVMFTLAESWHSFASNIIRNSWKKLCPMIDLTNESDNDNIAVDHLLVAFIGSGINEQDVLDWLSGNTDQLHEDTKESVYNETIIRVVKPEDPLTLQQPRNNESETSDSITITIPNTLIKTEETQET